LLQAGKFDVLVSDIGMPGEDGYSLIKRVRSLGAANGDDIPAIALAAYARREDRIKAGAAGFKMHVAKPVETIELITMIAGARGLSIISPTRKASSSESHQIVSEGLLPPYAVRLLAFRDPSAAAPSDFAMVTEIIMTFQTTVISY
jgi:CheY-like chemotaxis protein